MSKWVVAGALVLAGVQSAWAQTATTRPSAEPVTVAVVPFGGPANVEKWARQFEDALRAKVAARRGVTVMDGVAVRAAMEKSGVTIEWSSPGREVAKFAREVAKAQVIVYGDVSGASTSAQVRVRVVDTRIAGLLALDEEYCVATADQVAKAADALVLSGLTDRVEDSAPAVVTVTPQMEQRWQQGENLLGNAEQFPDRRKDAWWTPKLDGTWVALPHDAGAGRVSSEPCRWVFDHQRRRWGLCLAITGSAPEGKPVYSVPFEIKSGAVYRFSGGWKADGLEPRFLLLGYLSNPSAPEDGKVSVQPAEVYRCVVAAGGKDVSVKSLEGGWKQLVVEFVPQYDKATPKFGRVVIEPVGRGGSVQLDNLSVKQLTDGATTQPDMSGR